MKRVYVMLTKSKTVVATAIRKITKAEFSHVSLALDDNMDRMYSFARLHEKNPFIGRFIPEYLDKGILKKYDYIDCLVFMKEVTDAEYDDIQAYVDSLINSEKVWKFNIIGLFTCGFDIAYARKNRLYCSQFVGNALSYVHDIKMPRNPMSMQPNLFRLVDSLRLVYSGPIKDIPHPFTDETLIEIEDKTLVRKESK